MSFFDQTTRYAANEMEYELACNHCPKVIARLIIKYYCFLHPSCFVCVPTPKPIVHAIRLQNGNVVSSAHGRLLTIRDGKTLLVRHWKRPAEIVQFLNLPNGEIMMLIRCRNRHFFRISNCNLKESRRSRLIDAVGRMIGYYNDWVYFCLYRDRIQKLNVKTMVVEPVLSHVLYHECCMLGNKILLRWSHTLTIFQESTKIGTLQERSSQWVFTKNAVYEFRKDCILRFDTNTNTMKPIVAFSLKNIQNLLFPYPTDYEMYYHYIADVWTLPDNRACFQVGQDFFIVDQSVRKCFSLPHNIRTNLIVV